MEAPATVELHIGGMTCASCSSRVERHLNKLESVSASVNLATETATVSFAPGELTPVDLVGAVERSGYSAEVIDPTHDHAHAHGDDGSGRRLAIAALLSVPVSLMSMLPALQFDYWQWAALVLATPVVWWCGHPFHARTWQLLKVGEAGMDTLISLGSIAAWSYSVVALVALGAGAPGEHMSMSMGASASSNDIYLEVASGVVTLILLGRWLEHRARERAGDAVRSLLTLQARDARVLRADGSEEMVPSGDLRLGDRMVVRAGEQIPTDGRIVDGETTIDTSVVTGESVPRGAGVGEDVIGATVNLTGRVVVEATRVGGDTMLAQIAARVRHAQAGKAQIQRLADRVSAIFVPIVMLIAAATLGYWLGTGASAGAAFSIAVAVLIVACPCAMGLATPVALMAGTGRGAQLGILIGGAEVLESTRAIDTVVFDKTGTLTDGRMHVTGIVERTHEPDLAHLARASAVESASNHPIAQAIAVRWGDASKPAPAVTDLVEHAGKGVTARVDGHELFVGSIAFATAIAGGLPPKLVAAAEHESRDGATVIVTGEDGRVASIIAVADAPRAASAHAVTRLRELGLRVKMLTGDRAVTAAAVAARVGIDPADVIADVLPTDKADTVRELQEAGAVVAMVGDGINDAPALARANLGISMGTGSDVAIQASDITIMGAHIGRVPDAIRLARRTMRIIQGNLFWAFAYNVLAIPLAASGNLNPLIAAAAMAFSSLFVVLNSLRLTTFRLKETTS